MTTNEVLEILLQDYIIATRYQAQADTSGTIYITYPYYTAQTPVANLLHNVNMASLNPVTNLASILAQTSHSLEADHWLCQVLKKRTDKTVFDLFEIVSKNKRYIKMHYPSNKIVDWQKAHSNCDPTTFCN